MGYQEGVTVTTTSSANSMFLFASNLPTEQLYGGLCDGLMTWKTNSKHMFAGQIGDGKIQVYLRDSAGRLSFSHTMDANAAEPQE